MEINVIKNSRRIGEISDGDTLVFPDRKETVTEVDGLMSIIYTERFVKIKNENFQIRKNYVAYVTRKIFPTSKGHVYDYMKMKEGKND